MSLLTVLAINLSLLSVLGNIILLRMVLRTSQRLGMLCQKPVVSPNVNPLAPDAISFSIYQNKVPSPS